MYTKILVPLDGSETAECVLPYLRWFIKVSAVNEVVLLRVVEPFHVGHNVDHSIPPETRQTIEKDASVLAGDYLDGIAKEFEDGGMAVRKVVLVGKPAKTIAGYVAKCDVDLIIMATHGYSGIHRWVRGSVADEILHAARVPVLMVRPGDNPPDK